MDPYKVLGVLPGASQDEIREAYRELVKKYHPDQYANNPLSDLAQEKLKEINMAYDMLSHDSGGGGSSNGHTQSSAGSGSGSRSTVQYAHIREMINRGDLDGAERALGDIQVRNAEWNYLYGSVALRRGWYDQARAYYTTACQQDPYNMEYRQALNSLSNMGRGYTSNYGRQSGGGPDMCSICSTLWCADCCCECFGGDLIPCC